MQWPAWLSWYKKPEYRDIKEYSLEVGSGKRSFSPDGRSSKVPSQLKLERVLDNKTCSPMSLFDFYMYLKHIEFSEENLEFYIWYKNYERNYIGKEADSNSFLSSSDATLNEKTNEKTNDKISPIKTSTVHVDAEAAEHTIAEIAKLISSGATCARGTRCELTCSDRLKDSKRPSSKIPASATSSTTSLADAESAYRKELHSISQTFLAPGALKELNIPPGMRNAALAAIQTSSDPAHLRPIADHIYQLLRNCSHRNFVRLGVSNGTFETICVATGLGIVLTVAGFLTSLLLAFTPHRGFHSRFTMFGVWPMWWLGMSLVLSGLRGSCFFLLLFSRRQPLPWEQFADAELVGTQRKGVLRILSRLMIFDRKFRVKDVHLRRLQRKIVMQSLGGGAAFASAGVLLFILLPVWSTSL